MTKKRIYEKSDEAKAGRGKEGILFLILYNSTIYQLIENRKFSFKFNSWPSSLISSQAYFISSIRIIVPKILFIYRMNLP